MTVKELIKKLSEYPDDTDVKRSNPFSESAFRETSVTEVCESLDCILLI